MSDKGSTEEAGAAGERLRRWRLVLGGGPAGEGTGHELSGRDAAMDRTLAALYGSGGAGGGRPERGGERAAGLGGRRRRSRGGSGTSGGISPAPWCR